jgi:hypothetical protein
MANIFQQFVEARPVKTPLKFGHNKNIVIANIDFGTRKHKGIKVKANTFIQLVQVKSAEDRKPVASTEISFWDLDHTRDFVVKNLTSQFTILASIVYALGGDNEAFEAKVEEAIGDDYKTEIRTAKGAKAIQEKLVDAFKEEVEGKYGVDMELLHCKLISNNKGYLQPPPEFGWIRKLTDPESLPEVTAAEFKKYEAGMTSRTSSKIQPDATGAKPAEAGTGEAGTGEAQVASSSLNMI